MPNIYIILWCLPFIKYINSNRGDSLLLLTKPLQRIKNRLEKEVK